MDMTAPPSHRGLLWVICLVAGVLGLLPVILYWLCFGRALQVTPNEARLLLSQPASGAVLVDVRSPAEYQANHLVGAVNWPYERICELRDASEVLPQLRDKRCLLICQSGILSGLAARRLRELSIPGVVNVAGGMQVWVASAGDSSGSNAAGRLVAAGEVRDLPFRDSPVFEQWTGVVSFFVVKPIYTLLSLLIIVVLWRQTMPDLAALRWAMISFFIGENFCAANYFFCSDRSYGFEYLHSFGMVCCMGLATYAFFEGIDRRLVKLSDPTAKCAALPLCHRCIKYADAPCGLRRLFLLFIPVLTILAFVPLTAELQAVSYNTRIFGSFYNFSHRVIYQIYETRFCPMAAFTLFAISFLLLQFKRDDPVLWSKVFFAGGFGFLGFGIFRMVLLHAYRDNLVWFGFWEELTELLFMLSAGMILWMFQTGLFPKSPINVNVETVAKSL